jgi:hypothetical protein
MKSSALKILFMLADSLSLQMGVCRVAYRILFLEGGGDGCHGCSNHSILTANSTYMYM